MEFVIVTIVFAVFAFFAFLWQKHRSDEFAKVAMRLGLRFEPKKDRQLPRTFRFLDRLSIGSSRFARNVMSGDYRGHQATTFDYHYTTGSGKHQQNHINSFFILQLGKYFPELTITPEGFFSKIAQGLGFDDIDFESVEFSRRYVVKSADKKFAYDVCNARMIEFLLASPVRYLEIEHSCLALGFNSALKPDGIKAELDRLVEIRGRMPDYLFDS